MSSLRARWSLKWIVIIGSLTAVTFAIFAIITLALGHLKIVHGTETIEQITVPGVLESSRIVRNLEHLRRYGDTALFTTSSVERNRAQMGMTLIAMHPGMLANKKVNSQVQKARAALGQALSLAPLNSTDPAALEKARAIWMPIAEELTMLADDLTMESSKLASDDAHRIHLISSQTLGLQTIAIFALLICGLLYGGFLYFFIARPLQRTNKVLDQIENKEPLNGTLSNSPVLEIDRLRTATYSLSEAMSSSERHRVELEIALEENRQHTSRLEKALAEIKQLRGIIPICASCKKIRDDQGAWQQMEVYIRDHSDADFSHGLCPHCFNTQMEEIRKAW